MNEIKKVAFLTAGGLAPCLSSSIGVLIDEYNKTAVSYKKIGVLKVRETEFPKNTLRKIMRFKLDMTID